MSEPFWIFGFTALAGGVGAACRLLVDGAVSALLTRRGGRPVLPWGTLAVNLSGSLLIGVVAGLLAGGMLSDVMRWGLAVGLLGGYTTFSTASFESVRLLRERRWVAAVLHGPGQLAVATALAWLGWWIGAGAPGVA